MINVDKKNKFDMEEFAKVDNKHPWLFKVIIGALAVAMVAALVALIILCA